MVNEIEPPKPDLSNIRKHLGTNRPLVRVFGWGSAAAIALATVALATQTESGASRLQLAFAPEVQPAPVLAEVVPPKVEKDADTRALAEARALEAQLRALAADRDRLALRVASLERSLDDVTGSIKRQTAQQVTAPAVAPPMPSTPPTTQQAALPPNEPAAAETPRKPEIGIDIGGAPNLEVLNLRWAAVKANFGPLLGGLYPLAARVHRQGANPTAGELRLLVGPLPNMTAATQLCARFAAARVTCRPAKFDGERIAQH